MKREQGPRDADASETSDEYQDLDGPSESDRGELEPPSGGGGGGNTTKSDF